MATIQMSDSPSQSQARAPRRVARAAAAPGPSPSRAVTAAAGGCPARRPTVTRIPAGPGVLTRNPPGSSAAAGFGTVTVPANLKRGAGGLRPLSGRRTGRSDSLGLGTGRQFAGPRAPGPVPPAGMGRQWRLRTVCQRPRQVGAPPTRRRAGSTPPARPAVPRNAGPQTGPQSSESRRRKSRQ